MQVAVVAPTTLLCHQHFLGFTKRFQGFPIKIVEVSRLVSGKRAAEAKKAIADGTADIVIGTHALLAKGISFRDLGLMIIDEEQHFGVKHKERLKELKADVHVLTLTATPIPRTLQLALAGVKELSIIATPPVDRLALRTFTMPYDSVIVREAILREQYRGGQTFFVCPRIEQVKEVEERLRSLVPEVKIAVAHGRLAAGELEDVMGGFYGGEYDVLLSTSIVESGLDIPRANTIIIYRADLFGLAQLYQLRGRVGRGKLRGYAYLMLPANHGVTRTAEKRLEVMQTLDSLGAGFTLASHDLDIRGAGNLLGEEQSGHIREVGLELFQQMLDDAIEAAKTGGDGAPARPPVRDWSPQINLGAAVLIPDTYVSDLDVRMSLYRRLADLDEGDELDAFAAELVDRFGPLPDEVRQLLQIVAIKRLCIAAGVEKVEAGPKGATIAFHLDQFAPPGRADPVHCRPVGHDPAAPGSQAGGDQGLGDRRRPAEGRARPDRDPCPHCPDRKGRIDPAGAGRAPVTFEPQNGHTPQVTPGGHPSHMCGALNFIACRRDVCRCTPSRQERTSAMANAETAAGKAVDTEMETLKADLAALKADLAKVTRQAGRTAGIGAEELGDKANEEISRLKTEVDRLMQLASERGRGAVAAAEHKIEERPLTSVLVAFGVGLVIGKLIDRR